MAGSGFGPRSDWLRPDRSVVMADFKAVCFDWGLERVLGGFANVRPQFALADRINECADFLLLSGHLHFHPAVEEVAHPAFDVKALGDVPDSPSKADSLD